MGPDDWFQYQDHPELECQISRRIPVFHDPEDQFLAYVNMRRYSFGDLCFFHMLLRQQMTGQMFKRFSVAVPEINRRMSVYPKPIYTNFATPNANGIGIESDNPRRHRFALKFGWTPIGKCKWVNDDPVMIYRYVEHLKRM